MKQPTNQAGYSLVEVLVAVMILLLAIVGPMTIASKGLKSASSAKAQTTAFFLAQEGVEMIVKVREESALKVFDGSGSNVWSDVSDLSGDCPADDPCGVDVTDGSIFSCSDESCNLLYSDSNTPHYNHTSGAVTNYRREVVLEVTAAYIHVLSTVSWGAGADEQVTLSEYIYNIYAN